MSMPKCDGNAIACHVLAHNKPSVTCSTNACPLSYSICGQTLMLANYFAINRNERAGLVLNVTAQEARKVAFSYKTKPPTASLVPNREPQ
mmetsp:Transcript_50457/g.83726  ORF Transcript_50457/g.83726 Transcript_50457/m.83726 type:complete len:90 (-) Transcript_50457:627-896(-)